LSLKGKPKTLRLATPTYSHLMSQEWWQRRLYTPTRTNSTTIAVGDIPQQTPHAPLVVNNTDDYNNTVGSGDDDDDNDDEDIDEDEGDDNLSDQDDEDNKQEAATNALDGSESDSDQGVQIS
jgi:hypothetical protein